MAALWGWRDSSWGQTVLGWWGLGRDQATPSAETMRATLEDRTASLALPSYAAHVPVARRRSTRRVTYASTQLESASFEMCLAGPALLVGIGVVVRGTTFGQSNLPTLEDMEVRIDIGDTGCLDVREDTDCGTAAAPPDGFVPVSEVDLSRVLLMRTFEDPDTKLRFRYRSAWAVTGNSGLGADIRISTTLHLIPLSWPQVR